MIVSMNWTEISQLKTKEVLARLDSSAKGLSSLEAAKRQERFGPNEISKTRVTWLHILGRQFTSPFIYLLLLAAVVSGLLESPFDAAIIILFVILNAGLGFYQEFHSDRILNSLQKYLGSSALVKRDGNFVREPTALLVPGDILSLSPGSVLPADIRFLSPGRLLVNESVITGESIPVVKKAQSLKQPPGDMYQAANIGFSGTSLVEGRAEAVVISTGQSASIGQIAAATGKAGESSAFEKDISGFSAFVLRLIGVTIILLYLLNLIIKGPAAHPVALLVFSIALAVSVIPEALPVVLTFSLSRGAARLAKNRVVVKKLNSIEDLGSIEVLCTDKTGTLTQNRLTLSQTYPRDDRSVLTWSVVGAEFINSGPPLDPFDVGLWDSLTPGEKQEVRQFRFLSALPFDPDRRRYTVIVLHGGKKSVVIRGAPEHVLDQCRSFSPEVWGWIKNRGLLGERVLAVAQKIAPPRQSLERLDTSAGFDLVGLVSFTDPLKTTARKAVQQAEKLGISIKILTGDSPEVAGALAVQIGLIVDPGQVITGRSFDELDQAGRLTAVFQNTVFARVNPLQKNRIIDLLQTRYSIGFLGEGINDSVALKSADVGLVVEGASQIARESADIILLEKDLGVIIEGIRIGRTVASNIGKYIVATLASNFGNFFALAVVSLKITFLPLLPIQILLLNFLTDFPMISIATDKVPLKDIARPVRFNVRGLLLLALLLGFVSTVDDFAFFALFAHYSPEVLRSNWFIGSTLTELLLLFSIRTAGPFFRGIPPSRPILYFSLSALIITLVLPFSGIGRNIFGFVPPSPLHMSYILLLVGVYFFVTELVKLAYYKYSHPAN